MESILADKKSVVLLLTTLFTGLLAGVFFTWSNAITPGIGRLSDLSYLQAFQQMNRTIINPLFYIVIISPIFLSPLAAYLFRAEHSLLRGTLIGASVLYFLGVFVVTMAGNIPLNVLLDKALLSEMSLEDAKQLREQFESPWNRLHLIRTICSSASFLLLILSCLFKTSPH